MALLRVILRTKLLCVLSLIVLFVVHCVDVAHSLPSSHLGNGDGGDGDGGDGGRVDSRANSDINRIINGLNLKASYYAQPRRPEEGIFRSAIHNDNNNNNNDEHLRSRRIVEDLENSIPAAAVKDDDLFKKTLHPFQFKPRDESLLGEDPDTKRDVVQLITSLGFPAQTFTVQTKDGFLLTLHRIPYGRNNMKDCDSSSSSSNSAASARNSATNSFSKTTGTTTTTKTTTTSHPPPTTRPSVFLQHGLLSSAADWVMNFANDSLALVLADHGYDVWLGNSRGNTYSKRHVTLHPDEDAFWDWSFDEMAQYDTPAFIDFILNKTGESSLYYIGHSQGTITAFASFSSLPEYQKKIRLFIGLAPIITLNHIESPIKYLSVLRDWEGYALFGRKSFLTSSSLIKFFVDETCAKSLTNWVCSDIVFVLCGWDTSNLNTTRTTVYMNHTPAGTSVKNMIQYAQFVRAKKFAKYDYDSPSENMKHYGQTTPPVYNASLFNIPTLLFTATNDWLADPKDVKILESTLPNIVGKYNIPTWNHLDFVWGMDAAGKCYQNILQWLLKY